MKILILTADSNGAYPVPATKGGAVATLIELLADGNDKKNLCDLQIMSFYDEKAFESSKKYSNVEFIWVKVPKIVKFLDKCIFYFIKILKKDIKAISFKTPFSLMYYIFKARRKVKSIDVDKIVIENNIPLAMIFKNNKYRGKLYYHLHNIPRIDANCREVINQIEKFLCVSQYVADQISSNKSAIGQVPKEKGTILYNCVDTELFKPINKKNSRIIKLKEKYGIEPNDKILIFTGRLTEEKGADVLLDALTKLPENVKAIIVGSYHYNVNVKSDYQNRLKELSIKLGKRVIFTGYVQHCDLPYYYNLADVAILPSIWEEPAGLTNIEAMSCGIPVITTNVGGIPEYVGNSIILDKKDNLSKEISNKVTKLLEDKELYSYISRYSIERMKKEFNKENYINKFIQILGIDS